MKIDVMIICFIISILILLTNATLGAQPISRLFISDGRSNPLLEGDNGVTFGYRTDTMGDILAFIKIDDTDAFLIGEAVSEKAGPGTFKIIPDDLMDIITCSSRKLLSYSLYLSHLDFLTRRISEQILPLNVQILKPNGCKPIEIPSRPNLFSANFYKKQINPYSVLAFLAGGALVSKGIQDRNKYSGMNENADSVKVEIAETVIVVGAVISFISLLAWNRRVPDTDRNYEMRRKNKSLIRNWEFEVARIRSNNAQIKFTYTIIIK